MKKHILNYRIIVEEETYENGKPVYVAQCPTLNLADQGDTIQEAIDNIEKAIHLYLEALQDLKEEIPEPDKQDYYIANRQIEVPFIPFAHA